MAATFAGVATLAAVGGNWAVQGQPSSGAAWALALLALFGIGLIFPLLADRATPAAGGAGFPPVASPPRTGPARARPSCLRCCWAWPPACCGRLARGPILGLVLTGAALQGANAQTSLLLLAYALGAATSLAVALLIGGRVFSAMKRSLGASEWDTPRPGRGAAGRRRGHRAGAGQPARWRSSRWPAPPRVEQDADRLGGARRPAGRRGAGQGHAVAARRGAACPRWTAP